MFDPKQFISSVKQIAEEKGIVEDKIIETIEVAIAAAYKRDYGEKGQIIRAKLDPETGDISVTRVQIVVEAVDEGGYLSGELPVHDQVTVDDREHVEGEEVKIKFNPEKYILLEDARKINKKIKVGEEIITKLEPKSDFGRIAAQTAKQVIIQRLREVEREAILTEFKKKEGEIVSGVVQRTEGKMVYIDIGRTNGILPPAEQLYQDNYRIGQRLRFLILRVEELNKGPMIVLSRSHPRLVLKLFEFEVPEIESGSVEIKGISREAGSRSKIAVASNDDGVDPIGSLVGQKGVRVQTVINELGGEKIDIIEWNEDPVKFISNSLSPAKILDVKVVNAEEKHALVEVADDQFSLAIGKRGQNVRLAAKLTGWKIDVRAPQAKMSADEAMVENKDAADDEEKSPAEPSSEESSDVQVAAETTTK